MVLAAYVAEDGLVAQQLGGESLDPMRLYASSIGECQGQEAGVGGLGEGGKGERIFREKSRKEDSI